MRFNASGNRIKELELKAEPAASQNLHVCYYNYDITEKKPLISTA